MLINTIEEFKDIIGGTPLNNNFANIAASVADAKNFIIPFIGSEAYKAAEAIANGVAVEGISPELQEQYLSAARKPIAWKAQYDYVPEGNVVFDDTGIHTQKSNDGQTSAWQWQVYDLQQLYMKKAYNTLNELLMFLDRNRDGLKFWKDSEAEKQRQKLFVRTPAEFGEFFDIKGSFALFLTIAPDMLSVQRTTIKNALGKDVYHGLITKWVNKGEFSDSEGAIFNACKAVVAYYGLAKRIRTLPASLMPDGIVEYFHSDRTNIKASNNVRLEVLNQLYQQLIADGDAAMVDLNELINADDDDRNGAFYTRSERAIGF